MLVANPLAREDSLSEADLSTFMIHGLGRFGIDTIGDLVDHGYWEIRGISGFGEITMNKIEHRLRLHGYRLSQHGLEYERPEAEERTCKCHRPRRHPRQ